MKFLNFPRLLALSESDGPSDREMCDLLERVLKTVPSEVMQRSVCVVDKLRIRITQLPLRSPE